MTHQSNSGLLISFCNTGGDLLDVSLGHYDLDSNDFSYLRVREDFDAPSKFDMGFTGLCTDDDFNIYIAVQSTVPRVLVLNREGCYVKSIELPGMTDLHDIKYKDGRLWIVSTGNNRLYTVDLADTRNINEILALHDSNVDIVHFNSFLHCSEGGCLYSSTANELGESIGKIRSSRNEVVMSDLKIPHSLYEHSQFFLILNSPLSEIVLIDKYNYEVIEVIRLEGFLRGICIIDDSLYIGRSSLRLDSRKNPAGRILDISLEDCRSGFYEVSISDLSVKRFTELTVYGNELYDIIQTQPVREVNLQDNSLIYSIVTRRKRILQLEHWLSNAMT